MKGTMKECFFQIKELGIHVSQYLLLRNKNRNSKSEILNKFENPNINRFLFNLFRF
jgi:hypothetical protein